MPAHDVFLSHASEEKATIARPLAGALERHGLRVWFDLEEVAVGDSLPQVLREGLEKTPYAIVVLSERYLSKRWTMMELAALLELRQLPGRLILPVLHGITQKDVESQIPDAAELVSIPADDNWPSLVIRLVDAIRRKRGEQRRNWLLFDAEGRAEEGPIKDWLQEAENEPVEPSIAWPLDVEAVLATIADLGAELKDAPGIPGRPEWYRFRHREWPNHDRDFLLGLPRKARAWMAHAGFRALSAALGLKDYGGGLDIAHRNVKNLLTLFLRHLRKECGYARSLIDGGGHRQASWIDDIRFLVRHRSDAELASAHVAFTHEPENPDLLQRSLPGRRLYAPRRFIEELMDGLEGGRRPAPAGVYTPRQHGLPPELLEEFFVSQIEFGLLLNLDKRRIRYTSRLERWDVTGFKDEAGEHI
jgi:hypothetical protein